MPAEWDRFKLNKTNSGELTTVRHIAHVPAARRIVEDGGIKAGLVYDESRLNTSRISVAWVSANTWALGSIYGTVEFQFSWADLIAGQNIYWVEAMTNYRPPAYRLLLSKRNFKVGGKSIKPYDPVKDEGPLRFWNGKYYWNAAYTSEFMIEDDLSLDRCTGLKFVQHHEDYCRPFGSGCEDRQHQPHRTPDWRQIAATFDLAITEGVTQRPAAEPLIAYLSQGASERIPMTPRARPAHRRGCAGGVQHKVITERELARRFYYSRWFNCTNASCKTTVIMPSRYIVRSERCDAANADRTGAG